MHLLLFFGSLLGLSMLLTVPVCAFIRLAKWIKWAREPPDLDPAVELFMCQHGHPPDGPLWHERHADELKKIRAQVQDELGE